MSRHKSRRRVRAKPPGGIAAYLHPRTPDAYWKWLPALLAAAFALRAAIALSGDFVIHPDEIMQYLEQAHRLVFGSGVVYWEYFYGARSWLVPGLAAGALWICKILGLDSPTYYIGAAKLLFCAISLLIPWGMYVFSRRHWGESTARIALLAGVFWYELAGFAHKPMTEFVATSVLLALLAAAPLSPGEHWRRYAAAGALGALLVAVRFQYAPAAALILLAGFWRGDKNAKAAMFGGALATTAAVGILEWLSWGAPFYSYYFNARMNLIVGAGRAGESSLLHMPVWLLHAGGGLILTAVYGAAKNFRRRGFVASLILLILIPHMLQNHREYRFIFALIPLWLLLSADVVAVFAAGLRRPAAAKIVAAAAFAIVSVAGIFNAIPWQQYIYTGFSRETGRVNFVAGQDPIFAIYRRLGADPDVRGVADFTRPYFNTGGYYYLHHSVPFYDSHSWARLADENAAVYVSHIITDKTADAGGEVSAVRGADGNIVQILRTDNGAIPLPVFAAENGRLMYWNKLGDKRALGEYETDARIGDFILWKLKTRTPVREWRNYEIFAAGGLEQVAEIITNGKAAPPPEKYGIVFYSDSAADANGKTPPQ
ncbi:MAG: hypothetical protein ACR2QC_02780 [Gammaproteobacteria bacterium]